MSGGDLMGGWDRGGPDIMWGVRYNVKQWNNIVGGWDIITRGCKIRRGAQDDGEG